MHIVSFVPYDHSYYVPYYLQINIYPIKEGLFDFSPAPGLNHVKNKVSNLGPAIKCEFFRMCRSIHIVFLFYETPEGTFPFRYLSEKKLKQGN